jgi:hypothetical protein
MGWTEIAHPTAMWARREEEEEEGLATRLLRGAAMAEEEGARERRSTAPLDGTVNCRREAGQEVREEGVDAENQNGGGRGIPLGV